MNPAIKAQWIAALRSGQYVQGLGRLRSKEDNDFCCLGVLCDKHRQESRSHWTSKQDSTTLYYHGEDVELPALVIAWAEMTDSNPTVPVEDRNGDQPTLAQLNDDGLTFDQIADVIEYFL